MHKLFIAGVFLSIVFLNSCNLLDTDQPIPAFLDLKNPVVFTPDKTGFDTHKITDAWVFADGQILGVFPLPAKVPLIFKDAEQQITILAGIRNNGMNDTPVFYPFYKSIERTIRPAANETITIPLEFQYITNAKIPVNESFENGNCFSIDIDRNPDTEIRVIDETAILGSKSGLISLNSAMKQMETGCINRVGRNQNARGQSYIEMDYKGEGEIAIGIAKSNNGFFTVDYVLFVPARVEWNKIYVDVTDKLSVNDYDEYRIVLGFTRTGISLNTKMYVDNIKHVHF